MFQLKLSLSFLALAAFFALSPAYADLEENVLEPGVVSEVVAPVEFQVQKQVGHDHDHEHEHEHEHGDRKCSGYNSRYCFQTDYCAETCRYEGGISRRGACNAGGLGRHCDDYCRCSYGERWTGRHEGCHCYCYRRGGGGGGVDHV